MNNMLSQNNILKSGIHDRNGVLEPLKSSHNLGRSSFYQRRLFDLADPKFGIIDWKAVENLK